MIATIYSYINFLGPLIRILPQAPNFEYPPLNRLTSLALISIESGCVRSLDYNDIIDVFATAKARKKFLNIDNVLAGHAFAYLLNV